MATTPPPTRLRAHTPPTPIHGPKLDAYVPYSPRRSTRTSAHNNPYSSFKSDRSHESHLRPTTPPATVKKARFSRAATHLSSPPSSPSSPVQRHSQNKTPRKPRISPNKESLWDSDRIDSSSIATSHLDLAAMFPTPAKTPSKRRLQHGRVQNTARVLHFQPDSPSDVMPTPHRLKKSRADFVVLDGFELNEDDTEAGANGGIAIYTDANARVPEVDGSNDNPFVGQRKPVAVRGAPRKSRKSAEELEEEARLEEAVKRNEGVWFVHRGRKIFRPFTSNGTDASEGPSDDGLRNPGLENTHQRALRRNVGTAADRPLTRTSLKPRRLFAPSKHSPVLDQDDVDEEALTDIEMPDESNPSTKLTIAETPIDEVETTANAEQIKTPMKQSTFKPATPPTTARATRKRRAETDLDAIDVEDVLQPASPGTPPAHLRRSGRQNPSPFDAWPRTKGDKAHAGATTKRTRSAANDSAA